MCEYSNIVCENSNSYFKYCLIYSDLGSFSDQGKRSSVGNLLIFSFEII